MSTVGSGRLSQVYSIPYKNSLHRPQGEVSFATWNMIAFTGAPSKEL